MNKSTTMRANNAYRDGTGWASAHMLGHSSQLDSLWLRRPARIAQAASPCPCRFGCIALPVSLWPPRPGRITIAVSNRQSRNHCPPIQLEGLVRMPWIRQDSS